MRKKDGVQFVRCTYSRGTAGDCPRGEEGLARMYLSGNYPKQITLRSLWLCGVFSFNVLFEIVI